MSTVQWRDSRGERARRLDVELALGPCTLEGGSQKAEGLLLIARNRGYQPIQVVSAGIYLPDGEPYPVGSPYNAYPQKGGWDFSRPIAPGGHGAIIIYGVQLGAFCDALAQAGRSGTVSLIGFYEDGLHRVHKSRPLPFNVEEASKLAHAQAERARPTGSIPTRESQ